MLSKRPGRDLRARHRDPDRLERLARLQPELLGERAQRLLDRLGRERLDLGERPLGLLEHAPVEERRVGLDVAEEEAGELRDTRESFAIFSWTSGTVRAHELLVPVVALLAQVARRAGRAYSSGGSARR